MSGVVGSGVVGSGVVGSGVVGSGVVGSGVVGSGVVGSGVVGSGVVGSGVVGSGVVGSGVVGSGVVGSGVVGSGVVGFGVVGSGVVGSVVVPGSLTVAVRMLPSPAATSFPVSPVTVTISMLPRVSVLSPLPITSKTIDRTSCSASQFTPAKGSDSYMNLTRLLVSMFVTVALCMMPEAFAELNDSAALSYCSSKERAQILSHGPSATVAVTCFAVLL